MTFFLVLAFLFAAGSSVGWVIEVFWRRFAPDAASAHCWINPGFLVGPYLPVYGFALCLLFSLALIETSAERLSLFKSPWAQKAVLFTFMALRITALEYAAGRIFIKGMHIKLWDYSDKWGNVQGIICPEYTGYWWLLSAVYYFFVHPKILSWLYWFTNHLAFCFVIGFFFGILTVDLCYTFKVTAKITTFAEEQQIVVRYERLKEAVQKKNTELNEKMHFFFPFKSEKRGLTETLRDVFGKHED